MGGWFLRWVGRACGGNGCCQGRGRPAFTGGWFGVAVRVLGLIAALGGPALAGGDPLPAGPLSTKGSQIVGADGRTVRIVAAGVFTDVADRMPAIAGAGFNAIRVEWSNRTFAARLPELDRIVSAAGQAGLRVILDDHYNEGLNAPCFAQQANGLWYDSGGGSDGTDGCHTPGTVTDARFVADWEAMARHFRGNDTVIGYDLWNEPLAYNRHMSSWQPGARNPEHNIRYMYERVGNAILAIDSTKLIICEGPQDRHSFAGWFRPAPWGDLSLAERYPVRLSVPGKLVYSIHDYPAEIGGFSPDSGPAKAALMTADWGYLVAGNIAPVWIGEMGANMDRPGDAAWARTLADYANGRSAVEGAPRFGPGEQGIGIDWWFAGYDPHSGDQPSGIFNADGSVNARQQAVYRQFGGGR